MRGIIFGFFFAVAFYGAIIFLAVYFTGCSKQGDRLTKKDRAELQQLLDTLPEEE